MEAFERIVERTFVAIASRASDNGILALAAIVYFGIGLAIPIGLGWSAPWLVAANMLSVSIAVGLLLTWLVVRVEARDRRHLLEWSSDLRRLDAAEFEWLVGEVLRRDGWVVDETGGHGLPDGAIDLVARRGNEQRIVQCKRWAGWLVGVDDIRAFAGALLREGRPGRDGIFVTLSDFTPAALEESERIGLTTWNGRHLYQRIEAVRRLEPCPRCGTPMKLDRSSHGWWLRCLTPGCGGKRDLGREPGRAVEILTTPPS